jgi:predicted lipid carrier protein YhbT
MKKSQRPTPGEKPGNIGMLVHRFVAVLPVTPLDLALQAVADRITSGHPEALSRLRLKPGTRYRIVATDAGLAVLVTISSGGLQVNTVPVSHPVHAHVSIEAPISALIALLEGESDGDALFFARDIQVTGDTEALLMLRNAVDSAEIDFRAELLSLLGPLAPVARRAVQFGGSVQTALMDHGRQLQNWFQARPMAELATLGAKVHQLDSELASLRKQVRITQARQKKSPPSKAMNTEGIPS